ncbi:radial spoke head protein 9 homolog [Lingula anatina]|uniref:Radial spoke head protein 9 homolog n=1 Tax=Lingula anatina TaxID=7574 RepID=A0A1S3KIZ6_LINAN|nr:radial spoke head protein 9 homolog [Lingula anatina]|eukprot:XP_013422186.1 radial spoke head protein 9 homolog [Lingula anatina]
MEAESLHLEVDYVGSSGTILSPEQKAALQTSLVILKNNQKFNRVYYWGKILGVKDDYFIAQGIGKDEMNDKTTLYSKDCVNWNLLPPATDAMKKTSRLAKGRFTGDPSYEFEHVEVKKTYGENDEVQEEEETIPIKEEDRLASVISDIDNDVSIVPRAAFIKRPAGQVVKNRSFEGLTVQEAAKLSSYMHFRDAVKLNEKTLLQRANLDKAIDFLDIIEEDIPKGSWSLQFERGSGLVTLRSLLWLGYVFYHVPGTRKFGCVYTGTGEKNQDLPFML